MKKTNDYDQFIFRSDNREKVDQNHVKKLVQSIKAKNMLDLRPIIVNENMEVIDGQHRILAAKELGVEIYYEIKKDSNPSDIILMNIAKPWGLADYLNYYCKNGYKEYQKLRQFSKDQGLSLKVAIALTMKRNKESVETFRHGNYEFDLEEFGDACEFCLQTISLIKKNNGNSGYTGSAKFWKALIKIVNSPNFNQEKWINNLKKMIERVGIRATQDDYFKLFEEIYNWRNQNKLDADYD